MRLLPRLPVSTSRNQELGLLVIAGLIIGGAYTLAALGRTASVPADIGPFLAMMFLLFIAAHIALRKFAPKADGTLLPVAVLLNGIGYVFISRLDADKAAPQATWSAVGVLAFIITLVVVRQARDLQRYRYTLAFVGLLLLLSPLIPGIGANINGASNWLLIGPFSFQPSEVAKIALAIFFTAYVIEKRELLSTATHRVGRLLLPDLRHFIPLLGAWLVAIAVVAFERDLGSALLLFCLLITLIYVATGRAIYLILGTGLVIAGCYLAYSSFGHVRDRVAIWLDPWATADTTGYQIVQSLFAMGSGGITGSGLGLGDPNKIPIVYADFIFAAIGEELGLLGCTAILAGFVLFVGIGLRIAMKATNPFEKLLAAGLTAIIGLQSFIIIGGVIRVIPLTGLTLPWVSYGGSSLVTNYVLLAILLRISNSQALDEEVALKKELQTA